jgi:hypothetical protein
MPACSNCLFVCTIPFMFMCLLASGAKHKTQVSEQLQTRSGSKHKHKHHIPFLLRYTLTMKDSPSTTPTAVLPLRTITGRQPFSNQQPQANRSSSSVSRERILNYLEEALRILDDDDEEELFGEGEEEEESVSRNAPSQDPPPPPPSSSGPSNQGR